VQSPQEKAAGDNAALQAGLSKQFSDVALPEMKSIINQISGDLQLGFGSPLPQVDKAFAPVRQGVDESYNMAEAGAGALLRQRAKQSGVPVMPDQLTDAEFTAARSLEADRQGAMRRVDFAQAQANLGQWNQLQNLLSAGISQTLGIGRGAAGLGNQAIGLLSDVSPGGSALGGAAAGAGLGTEISPGWGTLIGGILGAGAGYFGSGG
jgi:hypothetical protein